MLRKLLGGQDIQTRNGDEVITNQIRSTGHARHLGTKTGQERQQPRRRRMRIQGDR
jgi:hypothetical protein